MRMMAAKPDADSIVIHIRSGRAQQEKVSDVLVSHGGEVKSFCKKLQSALENHRFSVFWICLPFVVVQGIYPSQIKSRTAQ